MEDTQKQDKLPPIKFTKRVGHLFEHVRDLDNLKEAIKDAARHKRKRKEVQKVLEDIDGHALELQRMLVRKPSYRPSTQCDESTMAFRRRPETSQSRDSGQISACITHSFAFSNRSFCIAPIRSAADAYREKERTEQRPRSRSGSGRIRSTPSTS